MELNSKQAFELIENEKVVMVDFMASWCGPCKTLSPTVDKLSERYSDKIKIVKINIDDNDEIVDKYKIMSVPTILFFKDGQVVDKSVGLVTIEKLIEKVEKIIN